MILKFLFMVLAVIGLLTVLTVWSGASVEAPRASVSLQDVRDVTPASMTFGL